MRKLCRKRESEEGNIEYKPHGKRIPRIRSTIVSILLHTVFVKDTISIHASIYKHKSLEKFYPTEKYKKLSLLKGKNI